MFNTWSMYSKTCPIPVKNVRDKLIEMTPLSSLLSDCISIYTDKISQQPENCENRNDPDLVQAFLKKWWVESDFKEAQWKHFTYIYVHFHVYVHSPGLT